MIASQWLLAAALPALGFAYSPGEERTQELIRRMLQDNASSGSRMERRSINKRATNVVTDPGQLNGQTYDYVIVGGGTTGLVVANRLTADSDTTVAVIEAGPRGTEDSSIKDKILAPAAAYFAGVAYSGSPVDWSYNTVNQNALSNRQVFFPRGKVLGGSSAVNGLYMVRASQKEHDTWAKLLPNGEDYWNWDTQFAMSKKSEHFHPPSDQYVQETQVVVNNSFHGYDGPIHFSYPAFFYDQIAPWVPTFSNLGVAPRDSYGGLTSGVFIIPSGVDPSGTSTAPKYSRSYAKTGYLDPINSRSNLHVLVNYQATKIVFEGNTARGVQYKKNANSATYAVYARHQVILSAGVIGTPQLLQLSGVGDPAVLNPLGIPVVANVPGVGKHFTDHLSAQISYKINANITGDYVEGSSQNSKDQLQMWRDSNPDSLYNAPNDAIAYLNIGQIMGDNTDALIGQMWDLMNQTVQNYDSDPTVRSGYQKVWTSEIHDVYQADVGAVEILMSNTGTYNAWPNTKTASIQAALQHPLSHGKVLITSNNPFTAPSIDPNYLGLDLEVTILREAFKWIDNILVKQAPLKDIIISRLSPAASSDADWETFIRSSGSTEYHPAGTASMLALEDGGVVDAYLSVYNTQRLRVADTSVVPISLSAHLTVPAYGIGETAAQIFMDAKQNDNVDPAFSVAPTPSQTPSAPPRRATHSSKHGWHFPTFSFNLPFPTFV